MDLARLEPRTEHEWHIPPHFDMRVPGVIYASEALIQDMGDKVYEQVANVASLPGIVDASYAMPDAHWGYGFAIGGVGFDISCGVRLLDTGVSVKEIESVKYKLADALYLQVPAGVGSRGRIRPDHKGMDAMLTGGAAWAVSRGYGLRDDLTHIEEGGRMGGALPEAISDQAKKRQQDEMGTLGSGNHYLEVQHVTDILDEATAAAFGLRQGDAVISIHCGSRGLGHQIGADYLRHMAIEASRHGIRLPERELACAPLHSDTGRDYLGAMRGGINCALANRQIITHLARRAFEMVLPRADLRLIYDVSHNTCKLEQHEVDGSTRKLFVHRKGATRAFGSACHGAGRAMSRHQAKKRWRGRELVDELASRGIVIRSNSMRGVAEEAPGAYKDVSAVVDAAEAAGLARKVARLEPMVCIKG